MSEAGQIIATIVYFYAGQYVATPALGTAGVLLKRISYGIALPSLIVAGVLYSHVSPLPRLEGTGADSLRSASCKIHLCEAP